MCSVDVINVEKGCFLVGNSPTPDEFDEDLEVEMLGPVEGHFVNWDDLELMQYTGFNDTKGTEIYESDVMGRGNVVELVNGGWCINGDRPLCIWIEDHVVDGNIHEHPELLKFP